MSVAAPIMPDVENTAALAVVTITPSKAQSFATCPYRYANDRKPFDATTRSQVFGEWIHDLIRAYNSEARSGHDVEIDTIIDQKPAPPLLCDTDDGAEWSVTTAMQSLTGYLHFLKEQGITTILDAERYVRTRPRPVRGIPRCSLIFAGRFDVAGRRQDGSIWCVDIKTGAVVPPARLAASPASFVYHHLTAYLYDTDRVTIAQINPITGRWASVQLTAEDIAAGKDFCRRMVAAAKEQAYPATPCESCAYCALASTCPAYAERDGWNTPF